MLYIPPEKIIFSIKKPDDAGLYIAFFIEENNRAGAIIPGRSSSQRGSKCAMMSLSQGRVIAEESSSEMREDNRHEHRSK
jgi:hypothetical protein